MTTEYDPEVMESLVEAFESGRFDYLFRGSNITYFDRDDFNAEPLASDIPRESVWHLIESVRRATGLLVFESAWGDLQVRVTPTAQLMRALFDIDTWRSRSLFGRSGLPEEEEWIVRDRLLVEEAVIVALSKQADGAPITKAQIDAAREAVVRVVYDDVPPANETELVAARFYETAVALPQMLNEPLTPELIARIHARLREGFPDAGLYRTGSEVVPTGRAHNLGVPADRIGLEMKALCAYAESEDVPFVHPLIKALAIAWWIRHVQPFAEYNYLMGRLISLGWSIRQGYATAGIADPEFRLHTFDDPSGDETARIIRQLEILREATQMAEDHLERRVARYADVMERFGHLGVNHRQAFILDRALIEPGRSFTIKHHARTRQLAYETARQDLLRLVAMGLLEQRKSGRAFEFVLAEGAKGRIEGGSKGAD